MWGKIAGAVASAAVAAYVGRKAYVANRTRKEENEALKAKVEDLSNKVKTAEEKISEMDNRAYEVFKQMLSGFERVNEKLDRLEEAPKFDADAIVKMVKDLEEAFSKPRSVDSEVEKTSETEVVAEAETTAEPAPEAVVSAEEMAELLVPRNAGKRNRKAA